MTDLSSRRRRTCRLGMLAIGLALSHVAPALAADTPPAPTAAQPFVLPETETWDIMSAEGVPYRIFVSKPSTPAPADGFPVLYVLDGNAMFASFAEQRRIQQFNENKGPLGNAIVVAIGYQTDKVYDTVQRTKDFTPPAPAKPARSQPKMDPARAGQRDKFLKFITDTLQPEVARRYTIDATRQSLFGHSLGGLFALHVAYARPELFQSIIAASPSVWWSDGEIIEEERAFAAKLAASRTNLPTTRLLVVVGGAEGKDMVNNARALARRLDLLSVYGLRSEYDELDEETHISVPGRSVTKAIRWAFSGGR